MRRKKLTKDTSSVIQSLFKKKTYFALSKNQMLQLWTIVLGTVTQYSYLSVISPFPHKKVHLFSKSSLPASLTLYKGLSQTKSDCMCQSLGWGEGSDRCVFDGESLRKASVSRLLSMNEATNIRNFLAFVLSSIWWLIPTKIFWVFSAAKNAVILSREHLAVIVCYIPDFF